MGDAGDDWPEALPGHQFDDGWIWSQRGSALHGSARIFSLIIESYWSRESSRVLAFGTISRP
jgi:hypothetical protein